jgi:hypothetical protein
METQKQKIKQKIVATLVIAFMFAMVSSCFIIPQSQAATTWGTNLIQNLIAGQLSVDSLFNLGFNDLTVGVAANSLANLTVVNMADWRGNGQGWTVATSCNALTTAAVGVNTLANTVIFINTGTLGVVNGSATGVATTGAASWRDLSALRTLVNTAVASNAGMGSYNLANTTLNVVYNGRADQKAGTYQATLTTTIVSN